MESQHLIPPYGKKNTLPRLAACGFLAVDTVGLNISFMAETLRSGVGTGHQSQHTEDGNDRRRAIADQGQCQADNGHNTDTHANVDQDLEHQRGSCAEADQAAHIVRTFCADVNAAGNDGQFQQHDENTAEETHFLADGGEDIVGVLGEQVAALASM